VDFGVRGDRFVVHLRGDYCAGRFCVREEVGVQLLCGRRLSIGIDISAILRLNLGLGFRLCWRRLGCRLVLLLLL